MAGVLEYSNLTSKDLQNLDPRQTVFFLPLSPLEAHGDHLPVGTDFMVAQELQKHYINLFQNRFPTLVPVKLPGMAMGADTLPRHGSIEFPARLLEKNLIALVKSLVRVGFKYLVVADNHGGPRHLLACEAAARKAFRRHRFYLVNPFVRIFSLMLACDPGFLKGTCLEEGACGDLTDLHGGTNETSLMLATKPDAVRHYYQKLPATSPPQPAFLFRCLAGIMRLLRQQRLSEEVISLGSIAAWAGQRNAPGYIGAPKNASPRAGKDMLRSHLQESERIFEDMLSDNPLHLEPPLWRLRFLRYIP